MNVVTDNTVRGARPLAWLTNQCFANLFHDDFHQSRETKSRSFHLLFSSGNWNGVFVLSIQACLNTSLAKDASIVQIRAASSSAMSLYGSLVYCLSTLSLSPCWVTSIQNRMDACSLLNLGMQGHLCQEPHLLRMLIEWPNPAGMHCSLEQSIAAAVHGNRRRANGQRAILCHSKSSYG